jgi:uncharacterized protein YegP (UPF0339 family)
MTCRAVEKITFPLDSGVPRRAVMRPGAAAPDDPGKHQMANYKLEIFKDRRGEFRWRKTASNGEVIGASSESYKAKKDCEANANRDTAKDKWEFYKDKRGGNRWRCFSTANKKQVGKSTEAFKSPADCKANARMNGWKG